MNGLYKIDILVVAVSLTALIFLVGYMQPLVIAPVDSYETNSESVLFSIEKADVLLVDDNIDFTTPDEYPLEEGLKISLEPGDYYWMARGLFKSEIRTLTILSRVELELRQIDDSNYGVFNAGNVRLNVDIYNGTEFIGSKKVESNSVFPLIGDKFVGGYDE
ncbi:MAG: hypothetical protein WC494_03595 [Candidatus Pacearchaeota archaeon]